MLRTFVSSLAGRGVMPTAPAAGLLPVVRLIATGGTIAMKVDPALGAPVPAISGEDLVAAVPGIGGVARVEVENLCNLPSAQMDPARWVELHGAVSRALARPEVAGVIVSHGTDTLEETAWFLDLTVDSDKPVTLVGAQRNASAADFDGPRNLLDAARVCTAPDARGKGAMLVLNGQINAARDVTKSHTSDVGTFRGGEFGVLGVADADRVVFSRAPLRRQYVGLSGGTLPRVDIVATWGGNDATHIEASVAAGARGVVVAAFGWGNVNPATYDAIRAAIGRGVTVVISTRVPNGRVQPHYGYVGGGSTLREAGAVFADDLSPQKARLLLMLALQHTAAQAGLQQFFDR